MPGAFDSLDDTVLGDGIDDYAAAELPDRLVVGRVDLETLSPNNFVESRSVLHENAMATAGFFGAALMLARLGKLGGNVLIKRTAERDVDGLGAAADAENGEVALERLGGDLDLELGTTWFDNSEFVGRFFAVITRVDVEVSAADQ